MSLGVTTCTPRRYRPVRRTAVVYSITALDTLGLGTPRRKLPVRTSVHSRCRVHGCADQRWRTVGRHLYRYVACVITNRLWIFGDGATSNTTATTVTHTYALPAPTACSWSSCGPLGLSTTTKADLILVTSMDTVGDRIPIGGVLSTLSAAAPPTVSPAPPAIRTTMA